MSDNNDKDNNPQKKSIIASLDLKNYKPKYTDTFGNGRASEVDIDNFLEAEPDNKPKPKTQEPVKPKVQEKPKAQVESKPKEKPKLEEPIKTVDPDFERRVNAEADNDFYDEKPSGVGTTFRSTKPSLSKTEDGEPPAAKSERGNRKINLREPVKVNVKHEIKDRAAPDETTTPPAEEEQSPHRRRVETYGIVISLIALICSITIADKPLVYLSLSLLTYLIRPIAAAPFGQHGPAVQNALKGFSIALFFGAIFFVFF